MLPLTYKNVGFSVSALGQTEFSMGLSIVICGTAITLSGSVILIRFLRDNPIPVKEGADASR